MLGGTCGSDVSVGGPVACHLIKHVAILRLDMANVLAHLGDFLETVDIGVVCCASFPPNKVFDATAVVPDGKAVAALMVVSRCNDVLE